MIITGIRKMSALFKSVRIFHASDRDNQEIL